MATGDNSNNGTSAAERAHAALSAAARAYADPNDPPVFLGTFVPASISDPLRKSGVKPGPTGTPTGQIPLSKAILQFNKMTDKQRHDFGQHLYDIGFPGVMDSNKFDFVTLQKAWTQVVQTGADFTAVGAHFSPTKVAETIAGFTGQPVDHSGDANGMFTGSKTQHQTQVDLTSPTDARALINNVLSQQLGRAARPEEVSAFTAVLNNAEKSNPSTATTTTQYDQGDATASSTSTAGGLGAAGKQQVVSDQAMKLPDYGAYQAATTYMSALQAAIKAPV